LHIFDKRQSDGEINLFILSPRIQLQLDRLHKNYLEARASINPVAFVELAHTLRMWTELADNKVELGEWYKKPLFKCAKPQKKQSRILKKMDCEYIWLYTAYFNHGEIIQPAVFMPTELNFSFTKVAIASEMSIAENHGLNGLKGFYLGPSIDGWDIKKIDLTPKLNLTQFLSGEILSVNYNGTRDRYSSKYLIQRTANELTDSSHFQEVNINQSERIQGAIPLLKAGRIGNISILYFFLLYVAQEIQIGFNKIERADLKKT
jgi:hypothetical protein